MGTPSATTTDSVSERRAAAWRVPSALPSLSPRVGKDPIVRSLPATEPPIIAPPLRSERRSGHLTAHSAVVTALRAGVPSVAESVLCSGEYSKEGIAVKRASQFSGGGSLQAPSGASLGGNQARQPDRGESE